jgi:2-oxoglutarate dehydrogenase E2 component (dihydrolipoamide succinyltransferase)
LVACYRSDTIGGCFVSMELKIPNVGESIQEVQIGQWLKQEGDRVALDEAIVELETDKASMEIPAPIDGVISKIVKHDGETVAVGEVIAYLDPAAVGRDENETKQVHPVGQKSAPAAPRAPASPPPSQPAADVPGPVSPAFETANDSEERLAAPPSVRRLLREHHLSAADIPPSGDGGRLLREDVLRYAEGQKQKPTALEKGAAPASGAGPPAVLTSSAGAGQESPERVVPMSLIRRRIAERLVSAQQNAALLTTFNEIDMSSVAELRTQLREPFQEKYGVKLGILSFFVKATVEALRAFPAVNAEVRGTDVVYRNAYHIGIAIGAKRGLVVPVIGDADRLSFAQIEQAIDDFAKRAEANKLDPADLSGGTFTISNGGIYGSLLSTPIVNPPQSGVLGLHAIQQRPVAHDGQVVIRPMMYVALTYDHRLIDGREAVGFLRRIKDTVESPPRLLIGV